METALQKRLGRLRNFQDTFPNLGKFGAEQYEGSAFAYGEKLLPPDSVGGSDDWIYGIANLRRKDLPKIMRVYTEAMKQQGIEISREKWLKVYLWLTRSIGSQGAEQYIRLGPAGLAPIEKPGFWERRRRKRMGL